MKSPPSFKAVSVFANDQMASVEEDDLAGLEDVSSDGEDDNYEADLTDGDSNSTGTTSGRRPYRKKARGIFSSLFNERS